MAFTKNQKAEQQDKLGVLIEKSASVVLVAFDKLNVADANLIRRTLQTEGVGYTVAKKTLAKRALDSKKIEGDMPEVTGQLALVYGEDALAPARSIYAFVKKFRDQVKIAGGVFEGRYQDALGMTAIATIPPLPILRGQFLNVINSPIQGLVVAFDQIAKTKTQ